jgi:hypothetical protein
MSKEAMKLALEALNVAEHFVEEYAASKYYFAHIAAKTALEEALTKQEEPLPPIEIGVDVTFDGASVVAFYRRPDAVMEMFYSQFHPLAKQEQFDLNEDLKAWQKDGSPIPAKQEQGVPEVGFGNIKQEHGEPVKSVGDFSDWLVLPPAAQQRTWVGLTDDEVVQIRDDMTLDIRSHVDFYRHCEAKLKEKNT